jgi:hypothetical protein
MTPFWKAIDGPEVLQGDWLPDCTIPVFHPKIDSDELDEDVTLDSPFLEYFSQAFAKFFMRVGLPSTIPPFK